MEKVIRIHESVKNYTLVIAIDFGTTRSGFTYCLLDDGINTMSASNVHNFEKWKIIHNNDQRIPRYSKDRTELLYNSNKLLEWGWSARMKSNQPNTNLLKRFKLKLQEEKDFFIENDCQYKIVDVVADYLRAMKKAALDVVRGGMKSKIPDDKILWCVTVPAIWHDVAVERMKQAAVKADLVKEAEKDYRLIFVREPEAAAVHCYFNQLNKTLETGKTFMVVDAGGGTLDLTSYKISNEGKLEEIACSSGGENGSSFVDENFVRYLTYLGLDTVKVKKDNKLLDLQMAFEEVKYGLVEGMPAEVPISNWRYFATEHPNFIAKLDKEQGRSEVLILTPEIVLELFNPQKAGPYYDIFHHIFDGVKDNIQTHVNSLKIKKIDCLDYIFLVGGFNCSEILINYIIDNFKNVVKNNLDNFIKPFRPEQAVMEGACLYAINPEIIHSRVAKFTYGKSALMPYDPDIHKGRKHELFEGKDYCLDVFDVICSKNESIGIDETRKKITTPVTSTQENIWIRFFCSLNESPKYTDDPEVRFLGDIVVPLMGSGKDREVEVRFYFGRATIDIECEDLRSNKVTKASINFSTTWG